MRQKLASKNRFRKVINSRLTLMLGLALIVIISIGLVREINRRIGLNRERVSLESEIAVLEGRNTELANLIDYLKSDEYAEEEARLKLGLKKEGESVVRVINTAKNNINGNNPSANGRNNENEVVTTPRRWWNYFFNQ
ncbi:MAG: septum formation initiator family protein [Patescibacteria group bacterium]